jgi:rhodanese-related sulfurtransferase
VQTTLQDYKWHFQFQIVSLTSGEQEWLSNHLGHEVNIDRDFYRTNDAVLEISKISRLLMVAHSGHMSQYAGKSLSDIGIEGIVIFCEAVIFVYTCCVTLVFVVIMDYHLGSSLYQ